MNARETLEHVQNLGYTVKPQGGLFLVDPPPTLEISDLLIRRRSAILRLLGDQDRPTPMAEALDEYKELIANGSQRVGRVNTGWADLDGLLDGTGPGDITVIAARPKVGKSAFGQQWARYIAKTTGHVLLFTFEMSLDLMARRQVCQEVYVPQNYHKPEHVQTAIDRRPRIDIYTDGRKLEEVVRRIRVFRCQRQGTASAVFIDQIGHVRVSNQNRQDELREVLSRLKEVAEQERLPIIGMHQINRGPEGRPDKRPTMGDLKDSGAFEEFASQVVLLYRASYYNSEELDSTVEVNVAANRMGPSGVTKLTWYPSTMHFGLPI